MYIKLFLIITYLIFLVSDSSAQQRMLKYGERISPATLNPLNIGRDEVAFRLSQLLFNSLINIDKKREVVPELLGTLTPQEISQDMRRYTFTLRNDVFWHDNHPFTANDVEFTFRMLRNSQTATNLGWVNNIVSDVVVINTHTVQFILREPRSLKDLLSKIGFIKIIPKHRFPQKIDCIHRENDFGRRWVCGTGPYKTGTITSLDRISLNRDDGYLKGFRRLERGRYIIESIEMEVMPEAEYAKEALIRGEKDLLPVVLPKYLDEIGKNCRSNKHNIRSFFYFAFNCDPDKNIPRGNNRNCFSDKMVRQALTLAVDRLNMLQTTYGERCVNYQDLMSGPYFPGEGDPESVPLGYTPTHIYMKDNKRKAERLLEEAGVYNLNNLRIELKVFLPDEESRRICKILRDSLAQINIQVDIREISSSDEWWEEVVEDRDFEMAFGMWNFHELCDTVEWLFSREAARPGGYNICSYINQRVEEILSQNRRIRDPDIIRQNIRELSKIIRDDCPYIFLFRVPLYAGYSRDLYIDIHPFWFFAFVNNWYKMERR